MSLMRGGVTMTDLAGALAEFEARVEAIAVDCPRTATEYRGTIGFFRSLAQTGAETGE